MISHATSACPWSIMTATTHVPFGFLWLPTIFHAKVENGGSLLCWLPFLFFFSSPCDGIKTCPPGVRVGCTCRCSLALFLIAPWFSEMCFLPFVTFPFPLLAKGLPFFFLSLFGKGKGRTRVMDKVKGMEGALHYSLETSMPYLIKPLVGAPKCVNYCISYWLILSTWN